MHRQSVVRLTEACAAHGSFILEAWAKIQRLEGLSAVGGLSDRDWSRHSGLEASVLTGPIRNHEDVLAILQCVGISLERGERSDDAAGLRRALAWLRAN